MHIKMWIITTMGTSLVIAVGSIVTYRLLPRQMPKNPQKEWRGRVVGSQPGLGWYWIASLEPGYERLEECVFLEQIVKVE